MSLKQFDKGYEPHEVEKRWYEYWENEQLFAAEEQSSRRRLFDCHSTAERNGRSSYGTRLEQYHAGYHVPLPPTARG